MRIMSVVLARQNSKKNHMRRPCTKKDAPLKQCGILRKTFTSSRIRTKLRFILLVKCTQNTLPGACATHFFYGEVHTNEEAQVYVHDLNLFVKMQLLEETLAVLSLGKLHEDHGYSNEWVSGQNTRLTKRGEQFYAKRTTSCLLLFQGYPPVLGAIRRQHRHRRIC